MPLFQGPLGAMSLGRSRWQGKEHTLLLREVPELPPAELVRAARKLRQPRVSPLLGVARWRGLQFIASEFFAGVTALELVQAGVAEDRSVPERLAAHIARQALAAVAAFSRELGGGAGAMSLHADAIWITESGEVRLTEVGLVPWLAETVGVSSPSGSPARAAVALFRSLMGADPTVLDSDAGALAELTRAEPSSDAEVAALLQTFCMPQLIERRAFQVGPARQRMSSFAGSVHDESTACFSYQEELTRLQPWTEPPAALLLAAVPADQVSREGEAAAASSAGLLAPLELAASDPPWPADLSEVTHVFRASEIPPSRSNVAADERQSTERMKRLLPLGALILVVLVAALVWLTRFM